MSQVPPREISAPEVLQYREQNVDSLREEVTTFIDRIHANIKQHPGMLKDGEGVFKQERLPVWSKGHMEYKVEIIYRDGSISKTGRPKKQ